LAACPAVDAEPAGERVERVERVDDLIPMLRAAGVAVATRPGDARVPDPQGNGIEPVAAPV